ncbi:hypothetical protein [Paenibacillus prosopidis]|uniref:Uncharacterized protein n=1 Tax=Paenibacillus prosopidis TaxID=630520 RepID=A0A368WAD3_9BACL|nr:hypothetical protein [Paenibacillus prosopidis]RCW52056.1 hypothetical protein DFP97_101402 [Paenibacillus prosopidis]
MKKAVGFDQKLQLHQLDFIARELTRTDSRQQMYDLVDQYLMSDIAGSKARVNARTILFKIWVLVGEENEELRDRAIQMFGNASKDERLLLHWGLMILAYPFLKDMAEQIGRLIQLHGEFSSLQLGRKIFSLYGERRRVSVSITAVLGTFKSLEVITEQKRIYQSADKKQIQKSDLKLWMTEVLLKATERSAIELKQIANEPCIFPFALDVTESEMRQSHLQVTRQGIDMAMVGLK